MRLHEFEGADVFERSGIPVPKRGVADTTEKALQVAEEIGYPVIAKAQVLVGGRGLAGGIKTAADADELKENCDRLLGSEIKGLPVETVMISEMADIEKELYLGITIDGYAGKPVIVVSTEGGVNIEKVAEETPEKIASLPIDVGKPLYPHQVRRLLRKLQLPHKLITAWSSVIMKLYGAFTEYEAIIAEINPLVVLKDGSLLAIDAVFEIDPSAVNRVKSKLSRDADIIANPLERKGKEIGVTYVDLDGNIGLISSGAGLGMASMDIIGEKLSPGNFLETGGGITADLLYDCMGLVMMKEGLRGLLINIYGGINPIHEGAKGVVRYIKEHDVDIPIVAKALGNRQEETWEILESGGVHVVTVAPTEAAVDKLVELVEAAG